MKPEQKQHSEQFTLVRNAIRAKSQLTVARDEQLAALDSLEERLRMADISIQLLQTEVEDLEEQLEAMRKERDDAIKFGAQLDAKNSRIVDHNMDMQEQLETYRQENERLCSVLEKYATPNLIEQLEALRSENAEMRRWITEELGTENWSLTASSPATEPKGVGGAPWHPKGANQVPERTEEERELYQRQLDQARKDTSEWPQYVKDAYPASSPANHMNTYRKISETLAEESNLHSVPVRLTGKHKGLVVWFTPEQLKAMWAGTDKLACEVLVPGWDEGTWDQKGCG